MGRSELTTLLSIGYQGRTSETLLSMLSEAGVSILVDVRLTPMSRQPGLSKRRLADSLAELGIGYRHLPALGNPRANREGLRRGEPSSRAAYEAVLESVDGRAALDELAALLSEHRIALLCFELDPANCHRQRVSDALLRLEPAARVVEL
jgi:uncharacterized protein (DUF488 family)